VNNIKEFEALVREYLPPGIGFKIQRSYTTSDYELVFYKQVFITETTLIPNKLDKLSENEHVNLIKISVNSINNITKKVENLLIESEKS
jgi:vacuolar-type H+-ATPase subunit F/Vma7